jgi:tight adherence protein C
MTALVVAVLVIGAIAGPAWFDLASRRRVLRRLAIPAHRSGQVAASSGSAGFDASTGARRSRSLGPLTAAVAGHLGTVGRPLRRLAGRPDDPTAAATTGAAVVLGLVGAFVAGPPVAVLVVAMVAGGPALRARGARRRAERDVRRALPDVVDLFRLAAGAGMSVHQAVAVVAERAPEPVGPALRSAARRAGMGERLGDSLEALDVLGDAVRPLRAALTSAARYGTPLGPTLDRAGEDARMLRRREAEERARRLPVQLLFPLVTCVLPAFGLLAVVPLLAGSLPALSDVR